eukprot:5265540-Pleurochrysis_carterae.AAC.2
MKLTTVCARHGGKSRWVLTGAEQRAVDASGAFGHDGVKDAVVEDIVRGPTSVRSIRVDAIDGRPVGAEHACQSAGPINRPGEQEKKTRAGRRSAGGRDGDIRQAWWLLSVVGARTCDGGG